MGSHGEKKKHKGGELKRGPGLERGSGGLAECRERAKRESRQRRKERKAGCW